MILKRTMKASEATRLTPVEELPAQKVSEIRLGEDARQAIFASHSN